MERFDHLEVLMLSCTSGSAFEVSPETQLSLQRCGEEEAQRFKWIQSEKAGRDLGEQAIRLWVRQHWNGFLRHRWVEHLQGKTFWVELQKDDFGLLQREFRHSPLIDQIVERLIVLKENLDIICWAQGVFSKAEMEEVLKILEALDVNGCRIHCEFDPWRKLAAHTPALA
jgi:hypothetical protein